jgi:hypothetical protein
MTKLGQFTITNQIVTNKRFKKLGVFFQLLV